MIRYLSVCSGIEAATAAWHQLGWVPAAFSEIEPFPRAVLAHHYPDTPIHGDFTTIKADQYGPVELLVGGTPCQSFSVAGLRLGLDDPRGNLALGFAQLAARLRPRWIVWENVPGVLSANGGRDFGAILGAMAELGYSFAYRVLDAQHFGVPQRRRRVFLVCHSSGDWRRPGAVLFEPQGVHRDPQAGRWSGQEAAGGVAPGAGGGGLEQPYRVANTLTRRMHKGINTTLDEGQTPIVTHTLRGEGFDASEDGTGRGTPLVPVLPFDTTQITSKANRSRPKYGDPCHPLAAGAHAPAIAGHAVRRLTPIECERLQGFPDDYTCIPWRNRPAEACPDGPRYKALGNSMAVPVMRWIGSRIAAADALDG
jgi:DNA (cytosine-5)-methyltransferase 1